jgi:hypothetical protein
MDIIQPEPKYITNYEASRMLSIPVHKIDAVIKLYSIPHYREGSTIFIRRDILPHIKAFVSSLEQSGYAF